MLYMPHNTFLQNYRHSPDDKYIIAKQTEEKSDPNNPDAAIANKKRALLDY